MIGIGIEEIKNLKLPKVANKKWKIKQFTPIYKSNELGKDILNDKKPLVNKYLAMATIIEKNMSPPQLH